MSEHNRALAISVHEKIATVFDRWLDAEVVNSYSNGNAVLNDYSGFEKSLTLSYQDPANVDAGKARSHYDRLTLWTDEGFANNDKSDQAHARQMFAVMMGLSGAFRMQCFVASLNQEGYMSRRYIDGSLGLDMDEQVQQALHKRFGRFPQASDLKSAVVDKKELIDSTHRVNKLRDATSADLFTGRKLSTIQRPHQALKWLQLRQNWVDLGVDYALYGAQMRDGDLSMVPMLEPRTIAEARLIYPFADNFAYSTDSK